MELRNQYSLYIKSMIICAQDLLGVQEGSDGVVVSNENEHRRSMTCRYVMTSKYNLVGLPACTLKEGELIMAWTVSKTQQEVIKLRNTVNCKAKKFTGMSIIKSQADIYNSDHQTVVDALEIFSIVPEKPSPFKMVDAFDVYCEKRMKADGREKLLNAHVAEYKEDYYQESKRVTIY